MGDARRRKLAQLTSPQLDVEIVKRVGSAVQKFTKASSRNLGGDCYIHAVIGQYLLGLVGIQAQIAGGFAAWRIGQSDGSVISHTSKEKSFLPVSLPAGSHGVPFHVWLVVNDWIIDFTTYQLRWKAKILDDADGRHTDVDWCPDMLVIERKTLSSYSEVAQGNTGAVHYERHPQVEAIFTSTYVADPDDLRIAKFIFESSEIAVFGPNQVLAA